MPSNLKSLEINLDNLLDINFITLISLDFYRVFSLRNSRSFFSILITEISLVILIMIIILPISVILDKNYGVLEQNNNLFLILLFISVTLILLINFYLFKQGQRNQVLAKLINKIEQYNQIIKEIVLVEKIAKVEQEDTEVSSEVLAALSTTKESLINSLEIAIMISHHHKKLNNVNLFVNLENNFTSLMTFDFSQQKSNYQELLNDALQIGITAHKEVRKLKSKPLSDRSW